MANKSNKNTMQAVNGAIIISALLVIVSMFFNYINYTGNSGKTGWQLFESDYNAGKAYVVIVLFLAVGITALCILRFLGMFDGSLFTLILAAAGAVLILFSILLFATVTKTTYAGINASIGDRAFGVILNLVFSIIAGLCCVSAFALKTR